MKKRLIICTSFVAVALSLTLFAVSVFAAVGQTFSISNKITFVGVNQYIAFDLNGKITGTTKDDDPSRSFVWNYDYSKDTVHENSWNISEPLIFNQVGINEGEECITYSFSITNKSVGKNIRAYIHEVDIDNEFLTCEAIGTVATPITIVENGVGEVCLKLKPITKFSGQKSCNFNIKIEEV